MVANTYPSQQRLMIFGVKVTCENHNKIVTNQKQMTLELLVVQFGNKFILNLFT